MIYQIIAESWASVSISGTGNTWHQPPIEISDALRWQTALTNHSRQWLWIADDDVNVVDCYRLPFGQFVEHRFPVTLQSITFVSRCKLVSWHHYIPHYQLRLIVYLHDWLSYLSVDWWFCSLSTFCLLIKAFRCKCVCIVYLQFTQTCTIVW